MDSGVKKAMAEIPIQVQDYVPTFFSPSSLVGLERVEEIVHTAMLTPFVIGHTPVSLIVVSESGAGKSKTLLRFEAAHVLRCDDLTSKGLFDIMARDQSNKVRYIQIPDFNPVLSHRASVTNLLIANLLTLSSEGIVRMSDGRNEKELPHDTCGIITACTYDMFARNQRKWNLLGITRRFLPVHYQYSTETIMKAQRGIRNSEVNSYLLKPCKVDTPKHPINISYNQDQGIWIEALSNTLASHLAQFHTIKTIEGKREPFVAQGRPIYPMSPHLTLQALAKAHAIRRGDNQLHDDDLKFLDSVLEFTNMAKQVQL